MVEINKFRIFFEMLRQKTHYVLLVLCFCILELSYSQITITSPTAQICVPDQVSCIAPAGATGVSWVFSGGYVPSNLPNYSFNVLTPATINGTFTGFVGATPVTFTFTVFAYASPVANFSLAQPPNPCIVKTVTLTDQSTSSSPIQSWAWTYGDGGLGAASGTHTYGYTLVGNFTVTLKVTDNKGCTDQKSIGTVNVISPPIPVITSNPPVLVGCNNTFNAVFSAVNSLGSGLTYSWDFGNGQTSNQITSNSITFTSQPSPYLVTLTVSANGCNASVSTFVTVSPANLSITLPATVCLNAPTTVTIQSNQPFSFWNAGGGPVPVATPSPTNPVVTIPAIFTVAGIQSVVVTAGNAPCVATPVTSFVTVQQVTAAIITQPPNIGCNPTFVANYTAQTSPNVAQFTWTFTNYSGALVTSTLANPQFTFSQNSLNKYTVYSYGNSPPYVLPFNPTISLVATSAAGCSVQVTSNTYTIQRPTAIYYKDKSEGCVPLVVTFTNASTFFSVNPITTYTWCDGGTTTVTGVAPIPTIAFTYTAAGTYTPYLTIGTQSGCTSTYSFDVITVTVQPTISFNFAPNIVCPNQPVQITNTSPNIGSIQHWHVESDNGYFSGCVTDPNPSWKFNHIGVHSFTMSGYRNSCKGVSVSNQSVTVHGPIGKFYFVTNCSNRKSVDFFYELQEAQTATLNFGDGVPNQTVIIGNGNAGAIITNSLNHVYAVTGDYTVTLTARNTNFGCVNSTYTQVVNVRDVQAAFPISATTCIGANNSFFGLTSVDVYTTCNRGYAWYIDNLPPTDSPSPVKNFTFTTLGTHTVTLEVKDINSCRSSVTQTIRASGVTAGFSLSANQLCLSTGSVIITNTTSQLPDPIANYTLNYGDGSPSTFTSVLNTIIHNYTTAISPSSNYTLSLRAVNSLGCSQSLTQAVQVLLPPVSFSSSPQGLCLKGTIPSTVAFVSLNSNSSYTMDYGVSPSSTLITNLGTTTYSYNSPGTYTIRVKIINGPLQCENTGSFTIIAVQTPTADFDFSSPGSTGGNNICGPNATVIFTNQSLPKPNTPTWNLLPGGGPFLTNSVVSYPYTSNVNTLIPISLTVTTGAPNFCTSSVSKNFNMYVVKGNFVLDKNIVCLNDAIKFSLSPVAGDTSGIHSWSWDFGDGSGASSATVGTSPPPPTFTLHTYSNYTATANGSTSVSLIYYSTGEYCKYSVQKPIKIIKLNSLFKRNAELTLADTAHCLRIPDKFNNQSFSNSQSSISYTWSFGTGPNSNAVSPSFTYPQAGIYQVSLTAREDDNKCVVGSSKTMTIFALPSASFTADTNCPKKAFDIFVNTSPGVRTGTWSPGANMASAPVFSTVTTNFKASGITSQDLIYSLVVTDSNFCVSDAFTKNIIIYQPAPHVNWDTTVVVGQIIPINANVGNYTYTWTPVVSNLDCIFCHHPISTSTVSITYSVVVEDSKHCAAVTNKYSIRVEPISSIDVPTAFTPNGDGINDIIYPSGWGIRKLNYFKIYNRWGQLLFESNDIKVGWDGRYQGIMQNMDTYVYEASVETYISAEPLKKTSTFKLIK